ESAAAEVLEEGDILLSMDGVEIADENSMMQLLYAHAPGDEAVLSILRGTETVEAGVILE
ncbi:MAG: PDZ domain-containing protein, partial [Solobacterium sp.]|nr:PDZ domain-containing protein [Solobacterium sp.]